MYIRFSTHPTIYIHKSNRSPNLAINQLTVMELGAPFLYHSPLPWGRTFTFKWTHSIYTLNYNCPKFFDRLGLPTFSGHYGLGVIDGYLEFRPIADPVLNQIGMDQFEQDDPIDIDR